MKISLWALRILGGGLLTFCLWTLFDEGINGPYAGNMIIASLIMTGMFIGDGITAYKFKKRLLP